MGRVLPLAPTTLPTLDELANNPVAAVGLPPDLRARLLARSAAVVTALSAASILDAPAPLPTPTVAEPAKDRLLPVPEIAELLGYAKSYVYEMLRRGELPVVRRGNGKYVRVRLSAVERWIAEHEGKNP